MEHNSTNVPEGRKTKNDLLDITKGLDIPQQFRVDEIAKSSGYDALPLTLYFCVLNSVELIWSSLKRAVRKKNTFPNLSVAVIDLIRQEVNNIRRLHGKTVLTSN